MTSISTSGQLIPAKIRAEMALEQPHDLAPWLACLAETKVAEGERELWQNHQRDQGAVLAKELRKILEPVLRVLARGRAGCIIQLDEATESAWNRHYKPELVAKFRNVPGLFEVDAALILALESTGPEGMERAALWHKKAAERAAQASQNSSAESSFDPLEPFQAKPGSQKLLQVLDRRESHHPPVPDAVQVPFLPIAEGSESASGWLYHVEEPATCQAFRRVAGALWLDRWKPKAERTDRIKAPSFPVELHRESISPLSRGREVVGSVQEGVHLVADIPTEHNLPLFFPDTGSDAGPMLPTAALEGLRVLAERGEWYPAVVARLIYHITMRCWEEFQANATDARVLVYPGGWAALAKSAGILSKYEHHLPGIVAALRGWKGVDGQQPALIADHWIQKAAPGRPAEVGLLVGVGLVPKYAATLPRGEGRRLIPAIPVPEVRIPGLSTRRIGAALVYQGELLVQLREVVSVEGGGMGEDGSISLPKGRRKLAAERAGLTEQEAAAVDNLWIGEGPAAWLKPVGEDRVLLVNEQAIELFRGAATQAEVARSGEQPAKNRRRSSKK